MYFFFCHICFRFVPSEVMNFEIEIFLVIIQYMSILIPKFLLGSMQINPFFY